MESKFIAHISRHKSEDGHHRDCLDRALKALVFALSHLLLFFVLISFCSILRITFNANSFEQGGLELYHCKSLQHEQPCPSIKISCTSPIQSTNSDALCFVSRDTHQANSPRTILPGCSQMFAKNQLFQDSLRLWLSGWKFGTYLAWNCLAHNKSDCHTNSTCSIQSLWPGWAGFPHIKASASVLVFYSILLILWNSVLLKVHRMKKCLKCKATEDATKIKGMASGPKALRLSPTLLIITLVIVSMFRLGAALEEFKMLSRTRLDHFHNYNIHSPFIDDKCSSRAVKLLTRFAPPNVCPTNMVPFQDGCTWGVGDEKQRASTSSRVNCTNYDSITENQIKCIKWQTDYIMFLSACAIHSESITHLTNCDQFSLRRVKTEKFANMGKVTGSNKRNSVEVVVDGVATRYNKFVIIQEMISPTHKYESKQTVVGYVGTLSTCFRRSYFPSVDDLFARRYNLHFLSVIEIKKSNGKIECTATTRVGEVESVSQLICVTKVQEVSPQSCKKWKLYKTTIMGHSNITKAVEIGRWSTVRSTIPPWVGYCKLSAGEKSSTDEALTGYMMDCFYYAELLFEPKADVVFHGVYDLTKIPMDSCGCYSNELCYRKSNKVVIISDNHDELGRYMGRERIKITDLSSSTPNQGPLVHMSSGGITKYGIMHNAPTHHHKLETYWVHQYIVDDAHQISSSVNNSLLIVPSDKSKSSFLPGIYSTHITLKKTQEGWAHISEKKEVLNTQFGKVVVDECLERHNDGTEVGFRDVLRCKRKHSLNEVLQFWIMLIVVGYFSLESMYFTTRNLISIRSRSTYWLKACLTTFSTYSPGTSETFEVASERIGSAATPAQRYKVAKEAINMFECTVINFKPTKYTLKAVTMFPILRFLLFAVLLVPFTIKFVLTIISLPIKLCKGKMRFDGWTFTHFYQFMYGPAGMVILRGNNKSTLKKNLYSVSGPAIKGGLLSIFNLAIITAIIVSSVKFSMVGADGVGQSISLSSDCEYGRCKSSLLLGTSLFFSDGDKVSHPLENHKGEIIGHVDISVKRATLDYLLQYQFTSPSFDIMQFRLICLTDDMQFQQGCWGRWWNPEDKDEIDCAANWGQGGELFISEDKVRAVGQLSQCHTWGPKGFWRSLSAPADGLEFIGVRAIPLERSVGRRQWTVLDPNIKAEIMLTVTVMEEVLVSQVIDFDRLIDTHTIDPEMGTIRITERRLFGEDIAGRAINCEYQSLNESSTPECYLINKPWEDGYNLNVLGEGTDSGKGYGDFNNLGLKRTGGQGCCGSHVSYKDGNEPKKNYYGAASRLSPVTGCSSKIKSFKGTTSDPISKCTDKTKTTQTSCNSAREAWAEVQYGIPSARLSLIDCSSVKLDMELLMNLDYDSDSSKMPSPDLSSVSIASEGCYGSNGQLKIRFSSSESKSGVVKVTTNSAYVSCPPLYHVNSEQSQMLCTSGLKQFSVTISDPNDSLKLRTFHVTADEPCKTYQHDEICDDCDGELALNSSDHWTIMEWVIVVGSSVAIIVVAILIVSFLVPGLVDLGATLSKRESLKAAMTMLPTKSASIRTGAAQRDEINSYFSKED